MVKVTADVLSALLVIRLPHNFENNKKTPVSCLYFPRSYCRVDVFLGRNWIECFPNYVAVGYGLDPDQQRE